MQPMPQNFDYPQPPWSAQTPSAAPHVYPYRPLYIRQPPVDPYQVFDEEGNPLYLPQHGSPPVIAGAFAQTPTLYNGQGMYASGSSTPTLRATTSNTSRRSQNMSGLPSSDSLPSSEQGFTSSHNRTASRQYISPSNTVVPSARSANFNGQSGQKKASMRMPKAKQPPSDTLPRPPAHSDFALWVGNVPSDATHAEMWTFFTSRPAPRVEDLDNLGAPVSESDLDSNGVKSIHLITRTNCCFVNYASQRHLDFALSVCHGAPLRPRDPRSKELVCRIRHKEDSSRSGVGAQRSAGIHKSWVADHEQYRRQQEVEEQEKINSIEREAEEEVASTLSPMQSGSESTPLARAYHREKSSSTDRSTNSTSSSFLARYFAKRYFILKSHTGEELEQSRQTATWSTQAHNQPVLDRAYATAREGVFLFFSANGSGEFYGVAR